MLPSYELMRVSGRSVIYTQNFPRLGSVGLASFLKREGTRTTPPVLTKKMSSQSEKTNPLKPVCLACWVFHCLASSFHP